MAVAQAASPVNSDAVSQREFAFLRYRPPPLDDQDEIVVKNKASWSYCGPLLHSTSPTDPDSLLPDNFHEFAAATFSGPVLARLLPFLEFINSFLAASGLNHYLLTVRATTPTHEFDQPRWHTDELFFAELLGENAPRNGAQKDQNGSSRHKSVGKKSNQSSSSPSLTTNWKACTTLLGQPTLFIPLEHQPSARKKQYRAQKSAQKDHVCLSIRCVGCASAADVVREKLTKNLAKHRIDIAGPGECSVFRVGREAGAMHSEPCMSEDPRGRIFVNVVPGTEEELKGIMNKWGMDFPRQWWLGSNVMKSKG